MRALLPALALCACAAFLFFAALLTAAINLLPYLAVGFVLVVLARAHRRREHAVATQAAWRPLPLPAPRQSLHTGQWVYVPVWVDEPPRPRLPVIDAEVIEDPQ